MITVHAQLKDKQGNEIEANDTTGHGIGAVILAAMAWGKGALQRADDPDVYVLYSFTQSKEKT